MSVKERQMTSWHVMRMVKIFQIDVPISLPSCTHHDSHTTAVPPVNKRQIDFHDGWRVCVNACVCVCVCKIEIGGGLADILTA